MIQADALILAGGKSSRMGGNHKGQLLLEGQTLTERLIRELGKGADRIWLSYGEDVRETYPGCEIVRDEFPGCGPLGGIHAGLKRSEAHKVMTAACDMPFLTIGFYGFLEGYLREKERENHTVYDGVVPVAGGRIHPLAAIYRKTFSTVLEEQIEKGNYRLRDALSRGNILYVDLKEYPEFEQAVVNVNTPSEYLDVLGKSRRVIAVCGVKNSGKTTLLVRLVKALAERGISSAVIKHDGHDFTCDVPETDSFRFWEAGAVGTAVYSGSQTFIRRRGETDIKELINQFPGARILFIEGMKESPFPKIEVIRKAVSDRPVSNPSGRFLLVTDHKPGKFSEETAGFEELEKIVEKCIDLKSGLRGMMEA